MLIEMYDDFQRDVYEIGETFFKRYHNRFILKNGFNGMNFPRKTEEN